MTNSIPLEAATEKPMAEIAEVGATPRAETEILIAGFTAIGQRAVVEFESHGDGGSNLTVRLDAGRFDLPEYLAERILRVAPLLIEAEMPGWNQGAGSDGRLMIGGPDLVTIDGLDRNEDWLLEREVDLDALDDMRFEDNDDGDPSP